MSATLAVPISHAREGQVPFGRSGYPPPAPMRSSLLAQSLHVCNRTAPELHRFVHKPAATSGHAGIEGAL
jgi:hypothetical protein